MVKALGLGVPIRAANLGAMNDQPTMSQPEMSLPEWLVLALLSQQPAHGFAVAQVTAADGDLGRIWQVPKAVVYRSIGRLLEAELIAPEGTEPGLGPQRTVFAATQAGRDAAQLWLRTPVGHVRLIRSELLLKLALLDRAGHDPGGLLRAQREVLEPIAQAIEARRAGSEGFDAILLAWRRSTALAALDFLDTVTPAARTPNLPVSALPPPMMQTWLRHARINGPARDSVSATANDLRGSVPHETERA